MKKITLLGVFTLLILFGCNRSSEGISDVDSLDLNDFIETRSFNKVEDEEHVRYCAQEEVCLWAGQDIDAGSVIVGNDDEYLYVTVKSTEGFQDVEENVKIWVGDELPDRRPPAGQFPYKVTVPEGETEVTVQIPLSDFIEDSDQCQPEDLYVLVHGDVIADGNGETAWGGCDEGDGNAWWYYIDYTTQCCACWCGFGYDYQTPENESCLAMMYEGVRWIFWSNMYEFEALKDQSYEIGLVVNSSFCHPLDADGEIQDNLAFKIGSVFIKPYEMEGMKYVDVEYRLYEKYQGYNIQMDLYIGADRIPKHDKEEKVVIPDEKHMVFQHKLEPGQVNYTFEKLPWLSHHEEGSESCETYISVHAAVGDCDMPSLTKAPE